MFRTLLLVALVLGIGTVLVQSQEPAQDPPPAPRQPPVPTPRQPPARPFNPNPPAVQLPNPPPASVPRLPRFEGFQKLELEKLPATVELDIVLVQWAEGTEGERKALSESLTGDAKEVSERYAKLQAEGKFAAVENFSLTTLDGHAASVKIGQTRPYVTSVQRTTFGTSNSVQLFDVGTLANLLPQVFENDKVLLQIRFEKSALENSDDLPALMETTDGKKVPSAMITRFSSETTLRLASGRTAIAVGTSSKPDRHLLLITAKVVP